MSVGSGEEVSKEDKRLFWIGFWKGVGQICFVVAWVVFLLWATGAFRSDDSDASAPMGEPIQLR